MIKLFSVFLFGLSVLLNSSLAYAGLGKEYKIQKSEQFMHKIASKKQKKSDGSDKDAKEEIISTTFKIPEWCEDLEQRFNVVQVCGIASHRNLQMSRTRSELDARKQLARRMAGDIEEVIIENDGGDGGNVQTTAIAKSRTKLGPYIIIKQVTIESDNKYLTFTKVRQYFE
jgi:hypothetical protein